MKTSSSAMTVEYDENGKRIWPDYWLEERDGRVVLCRKSHPSMPEDENVDYVDCETAFEDPWSL